MPTFTPNYSFKLPGVADPVDADLWGGQLNGNFSSLDTLLKNSFADVQSGTWTPELTGSTGAPTITYTTQLGEYIRLAKFVHVECRIQVNTTSGGSGTLKITNLPFTISTVSGALGGGNIVKASGWLTACPTAGFMETGTSIDLTYPSGATSIAEVPIANLTAGSQLWFTGQYISA